MAAFEGSPEPARRPGWLRSELGMRVVSALVMAAAALLATYQGGWPFALFWLAAGVAILFEWTKVASVEPLGAARIVGATGLAAVVVAEGLARAPLLPILAALASMALLAAVLRSRRDRLWGAGGFACAAVIAAVPPAVREHPDLGVVGLLWMFAVVWVTDVAAYFTGRRFGGPKLWPRVSPKKTWSGFVGGLAAGTGAGVLVAAVAEGQGWAPQAPLWLVAVVSAVGSVVGQLGDLAESAIKRRFDVKDSGQLIPGHGGVMDRLDAFWSVSVLVGLMLIGMRLAGRW